MPGKRRARKSAPRCGGVEEDVVLAGRAEVGGDRGRDDVARGEVGQRVGADHDPAAVAVDEDGALAAHRLGDQRLLAPRPPDRSRARSGGTAPSRRRRPRRRPAARAPARRRWRRRGWTTRRTPGRSRRWRARSRRARRSPASTSAPSSPIRATRRPTTRPSAARSASRATVCSSTSMPRARRAPASVRVTSAPLASPPACTIRSRLCPPSRVSAGRPWTSRSSRAPSSRRTGDGGRGLLDEGAHGGLVAEAGAGDERVLHVQFGVVVRHRGRRPARPGPRRCCRRRARPW